MERKGIILAGGKGTRLYPATKAISKQLIPIFDKPMIYYPLCTLLSAKIREILIISTPQDLNHFKNLLGNGNRFGCDFHYQVQDNPNGIAEAYLISENFLQKHPSTLILGDNIFLGDGLDKILYKISLENKTTIFGYKVANPENYGVITFDNAKKIIGFIEKPEKPVSNIVMPGLYFLDENAVEYAKKLSPSSRGELEITELINSYLVNKKLNYNELGTGMIWFDAGTHDSLLEASMYIQAIQNRQGMLISSPELTSFYNGWISKSELINISKFYSNNYGKKLIIRD